MVILSVQAGSFGGTPNSVLLFAEKIEFPLDRGCFYYNRHVIKVNDRKSAKIGSCF